MEGIVADQAHEINKLQEELQKVAAEAEFKAVAAKTAAESTAKALTEKTLIMMSCTPRWSVATTTSPAWWPTSSSSS